MSNRPANNQLDLWGRPKETETSRLPSDEAPRGSVELEDCLWSESVALDPKHRPQTWDAPSSTVRRQWCKYPQEAHLLDLPNGRYRRLVPDEIAILQGFDPSWFDVPGLSTRNKMRAIGDAVPPPLARAVVSGIDSVWEWKTRSAVEICAGSGGLSSGAASVEGMQHLLLLDHWEPACDILSHEKPWSRDRVACASVRDFDFSKLRDRVGLLSGGPPCQPWSQGGRRKGVFDERDLLADIHRVIDAVRPEVFVFENVPGLTTELQREYLSAILGRLRTPRSGVTYGVIAGVLNAADFGVPQRRRRVFLLGLRERTTADAYRIFDRIQGRATHRDPRVPHRSRKRWKTLREAFDGMPDPGGWRRWITVDDTRATKRSR